MKFTFKTDKPTGAYSSFYPDMHHIKLNKKIVGRIDDKLPHKIRLMIVKGDIMEDGNPNCPWKWITLNVDFSSVNEAKEFLNEHIVEIMQKWTLSSREGKI